MKAGHTRAREEVNDVTGICTGRKSRIHLERDRTIRTHAISVI